MLNENREELISEILKIEVEMFLTVPAREKTTLQDKTEVLKLFRRSSYEFWSEQTLKSYLHDLKTAQLSGKNLWTHKYALMEKLIPSSDSRPIIEEIIKIETIWEEEIRNKYPFIFKDIPNESNIPFSETFSKYLLAELETYSDMTLYYYYYDLLEALKAEKNLVEEIYTYIFRKIGYKNLAEANLFLKCQTGP